MSIKAHIYLELDNFSSDGYSIIIRCNQTTIVSNDL